MTISLMLEGGAGREPLEARVDLDFLSSRKAAGATSDQTGVIHVDLEPGTWWVMRRPTKSQPYWLARTALEVPVGRKELRSEVILQETRLVDLHGTLISDTDGTPVAGVLIWRKNLSGDRYSQVGVTDREGRFSIQNVWEHEVRELMLRHTDVDGQQKRAVSAEELKTGQITWKVPVLPPAPVIRIRLMGVRDGKRVPLTEGFTGRTWDKEFLPVLRCAPVLRDRESGNVTGLGTPRSHEIDERGVCLIKRLPSAEFVIQSLEVGVPGSREATAYYPVAGDMGFVVPTEGAAVVEVETVLAPEPLEFTIRGKVLDQSTALPAAGARIQAGVSSGLGLSSKTTTTDRDGTFSLRVPPSFVELYVEGVGFVPASESLYVTSDTSAEFQLERIYVYAGCVVDLDGVPVQLASLLLEREGQHWQSNSDRQGQFLFGSLPPGEYSLHVTGPTHFPVRQEIKVTGDVRDATVTLEKGAVLTGHLRFDQGIRPNACLSLLFVDSETLCVDSLGLVDEAARHGSLVRKKRLTVYLQQHEGKDADSKVVALYELGELTVDKDETTQDFHVTKQMLEKPLDREEVPFH
ncbi:MAG: carboxypeptidase regulatory-like domain-containing protein [Verrucomicrobia bacterium]|nr:carboxypeptidase regulatory-like domain-containing protein [Verrucomicrobiota bacterium]